MKNFWQIFGEAAIALFFIIIFLFFLTSCSGGKRVTAPIPEEEQNGNFLTTKNIPQFGGKEFFGVMPSDLILTKVATGGVDSLLVLADSTVRCVPGKYEGYEGTATKVSVYANPKTPSLNFTYGQDINGKYVILGKPGVTKRGLPTLFYGGEEYFLLSGGEGILIEEKSSTTILPGWKPDPPKN